MNTMEGLFAKDLILIQTCVTYGISSLWRNRCWFRPRKL